MSLNTTPRTWVASEIVDATEMNTEVRDALTGLQAAWDTYTPTWTANTTNPSLGNGTRVGRFLRIGKTVHVRIEIVAGSTTTFGSGFFILSLPVAARTTAGSDGMPGSVYLLDASGGARQFGGVILQSSTSVRMFGPTGASIDSATPWAWATTDAITVDFIYEAA